MEATSIGWKDVIQNFTLLKKCLNLLHISFVLPNTEKSWSVSVFFPLWEKLFVAITGKLEFGVGQAPPDPMEIDEGSLLKIPAMLNGYYALQ